MAEPREACDPGSDGCEIVGFFAEADSHQRALLLLHARHPQNEDADQQQVELTLERSGKGPPRQWSLSRNLPLLRVGRRPKNAANISMAGTASASIPHIRRV